MRKAAYRLASDIPAPLVYFAFALLLMLATAPVWRIVLFGLSVDDLLQLRCFGIG